MLDQAAWGVSTRRPSSHGSRSANARSSFGTGLGGSVGSKLPFVPVDPEQWLDPGSWLNDGKTIVAGLIGAYLAVELMKRVLDVRVKTGDTFALPLALALALGRLGCYCNGCCYGVETGLPWGTPFLNVPVFEPPAIDPSPVEGIPHINLDLALEFLIGDRLR